MYTFDELIDRRHTESTKWDRYQDKLQRDDLLPMWMADMDLPASDEIKEALMKRASHPIYGYSDRGRLYYEVFAERFQKQYAYPPVSCIPLPLPYICLQIRRTVFYC